MSGVLPAGWASVRLGDFGTWRGGGTPSKANAEFWSNGSIPWISPKDMGPEVLTGTQDAISVSAVAGSSVRLVPAGSVAVVVRSGILERKLPVAWVPFEATLNQDMKALTPNVGIEPKWVSWGLRAYEREILDRCRKTGTTVASIDSRKLMDFEFPVPPLEEQRRIVAILDDHLSRLDAAEALLQKSSVRLRGLGEAIMRSDLLGATHVGERHPPNLPVVGTNDGALADLPAGWRWTRLGELADVVGGVTKDSKRQSDPSFVEVPYLRVANVQRGRLDLSKISTIRVPPARAAALLLLPGDVLLNEGGDRDKLGRGWVWDGQIPDCIHQNHVFRARVIDDSIVPRLLSWAANVIGGPWCESNGIQSVNLASISLKKIRLMPVPVPPVELQPAIAAKIADRLAGIEHLHRDLDAALNRSKALRRSLLEAAFSGRLTGSAVPDSAAESATT